MYTSTHSHKTVGSLCAFHYVLSPLCSYLITRDGVTRQCSHKELQHKVLEFLSQEFPSYFPTGYILPISQYYSQEEE